MNDEISKLVMISTDDEAGFKLGFTVECRLYGKKKPAWWDVGVGGNVLTEELFECYTVKESFYYVNVCLYHTVCVGTRVSWY